MMTPQEVSSTTFPKAKLGGYSMAAVDVFLDKLTEDYTELFKENAALKSKMKVLVDKMEEYHSMEDTMRSTLLTAQKMANSMISEAEEKRTTIISDAEAKREAMISDAEADARVRMRELAADVAAEERRLAAVHEEIDRQIAIEQERLVVAQRELAAFINGAKALCARQLGLIERLGELDILPAGFQMTQENTPAEPETIDEPIEPQQDEPTVEELSDAPAEETSVDTEDVATAHPHSEVIAQVERMRNMTSSFAANGEISTKDDADTPFEIDFDDASKLFSENPEEKRVEDPFENSGDPFENSGDDSYDNFDGEEQESTRVLNLNDLQFGRNYNKD